MESEELVDTMYQQCAWEDQPEEPGGKWRLVYLFKSVDDAALNSSESTEEESSELGACESQVEFRFRPIPSNVDLSSNDANNQLTNNNLAETEVGPNVRKIPSDIEAIFRGVEPAESISDQGFCGIIEEPDFGPRQFLSVPNTSVANRNDVDLSVKVKRQLSMSSLVEHQNMATAAITTPTMVTTASAMGALMEDEKDYETPTAPRQRQKVIKDDKFINALRERHLPCEIIQAIEFKFESLDILWTKLQNPQLYEGFIFTSERGVQAVIESIKLHEDMKTPSGEEPDLSFLMEWSRKIMFCVGPATIEKVKELFEMYFEDQPNDSRRIITGIASNARSLGDKIVAVHSEEHFNLTLIYPCGNLKTPFISYKLEKNEIAFEELTVYRTVEPWHLPATLADFRVTLLKAFQSDHARMQLQIIVCFFSPSGVRTVYDNFTFRQFESYFGDDRVKLVAVGPTTRDELERVLFGVGLEGKMVWQLDKPTPESLLHCIYQMYDEIPPKQGCSKCLQKKTQKLNDSQNDESQSQPNWDQLGF